MKLIAELVFCISPYMVSQYDTTHPEIIEICCVW